MNRSRLAATNESSSSSFAWSDGLGTRLLHFNPDCPVYASRNWYAGCPDSNASCCRYRAGDHNHSVPRVSYQAFIANECTEEDRRPYPPRPTDYGLSN